MCHASRATRKRKRQLLNPNEKNEPLLMMMIIMLSAMCILISIMGDGCLEHLSSEQSQVGEKRNGKEDAPWKKMRPVITTKGYFQRQFFLKFMNLVVIEFLSS